jgi:hypothetical protein
MSSDPRQPRRLEKKTNILQVSSSKSDTQSLCIAQALFHLDARLAAPNPQLTELADDSGGILR